jgi:hypothetical protein
MKIVAVIARELLGLFVDDGRLAVSTIVVFALAVVAALLVRAPSLVTGGLLLAGCVAILCENVLRSRRA